MTLTPEEKTQVIGWLKAYPKGTPSSAWGFGPMEEVIEYDEEYDDEHDDYPLPETFDTATRAKYG